MDGKIDMETDQEFEWDDALEEEKESSYSNLVNDQSYDYNARKV